MKRCEYCGSMNSEESRVCTACGAPFSLIATPKDPQTLSSTPSQLDGRSKRRFLMGGVAVLLVLLVVLLITGKQKSANVTAVGTRPASASESDTVRELHEKSAGYMAKGDYESVLRLASQNRGLFQNNADLCADYEASAVEFRKSIIAEAKSVYQNSTSATDALAVINRGLAVLSQDNKLLKYYDLFTSCAKTDLSSLTVLNENSVYMGTASITDPFGQEHTGAFLRLCMTYFDTICACEYVLNGQYSEFEANYFIKKYDAQLKIYVDGVSVFDSGIIDKSSGTMHVSVPLENVRILRVEAVSCSTISVFGDIDTSDLYLVDTALTHRKLTDAELDW